MIILIILAAISISALTKGNFIGLATKAAQNYAEAQEYEGGMMENYKTLLDAVVGNITGNPPPAKEEEFKIGDYVNYTPKSNGSCNIDDSLSGVTEGATGSQTFTTEAGTDMKWRIFDYDKDTITIISDKPTSTQLTLEGANGYNNGVYILNKICKDCYSSEDPKLEARSINIEDVRGIMKDVNANIDVEIVGYKLGDSETYTDYDLVPKIWKEYEKELEAEIGNHVSEQDKTYTEDTIMPTALVPDEPDEPDEGLTFYQTFWTNADMTSMQDGMPSTLLPWKDDAYKDIMFGAVTLDLSLMGSDPQAINKMFWLASRYVGLASDFCGFGLQGCEFRLCVQRHSCSLKPDTPMMMRFLFAP